MALWIRNPLTGLRRAPSVRSGAAVVAGTAGVFVVANVLFGGDINFGDVLASEYNVRHGLIEPMAVTLAFLVATLTFLGWWRAVLREPRRSAPRWTLAVVAVGIAGPVADIVRAGDASGFRGEHRTTLVIGLVLVAAVEELAVRGALLIGLRDIAVESAVFLAVTLVGAALQLFHFALGENVAVTLRSAATALAIGALTYLVRRATGQLLAGVVVHALALTAVAVTAGPVAALGDATREVPAGTAVAVGVAVVALLLGRSVLFDTRVTIPRTLRLDPNRPAPAPDATGGPKPWLGERKPF